MIARTPVAGLGVSVTVDPGWQVAIKGLEETLKHVGSATMNRAGRLLQSRLRRQVRAAGLGTGLEKAIRTIVYPRARKSLGAAALVYSKATRVHEAFQADRVIAGRGGGYLALPLPAAVRIGADRDPQRGGGTGAAPPRKWSSVDAAEAKIGRLYLRPIGRGRALLVSRDGTAYFLLLPAVHLRKRLDWASQGEKVAGDLPALFDLELQRRVKQSRQLLDLAGGEL